MKVKSFEHGMKVRFGNSPILGHVLMSNSEESLVHFDDGDRCTVSTEYLTEVTV
jgi:hypothetical protein